MQGMSLTAGKPPGAIALGPQSRRGGEQGNSYGGGRLKKGITCVGDVTKLPNGESLDQRTPKWQLHLVLFVCLLFVLMGQGYYLWLSDRFCVQRYAKQAGSKWLNICFLRLYLKQLDV